MNEEQLAPRKLITAEQFWNMPLDGHKYELVRGELIEMTPPGGQHGRIAVDVKLCPQKFCEGASNWTGLCGGGIQAI